jgi:hypothetical protein
MVGFGDVIGGLSTDGEGACKAVPQRTGDGPPWNRNLSAWTKASEQPLYHSSPRGVLSRVDFEAVRRLELRMANIFAEN